MSTTTMNDTLAAVRAHLDSRSIRYQVDIEKNIFLFGVAMSGKLNRCQIAIMCRADCIRCQAVSPLNAEESVRPAMAEFIARVNSHMLHGCFAMDFDSGEIRYSCTIHCPEHIPDAKETAFCIDLPILMMQRYGEGLVSVLFGLTDPATAVRQCETKK